MADQVQAANDPGLAAPPLPPAMTLMTLIKMGSKVTRFLGRDKKKKSRD